MEKNKKSRKEKLPSSDVRSPEPFSQKVIDKIINQSIELHQQGKVKEALKVTEQALNQFPDQLQLLGCVSIFAATIGDFKKAEKYFRIILQNNPNDADTHYKLGRLLKDQQHFDEAQKHYQSALEINPNHAEAHNNLGSLFNEQQRFDEAERAYQRAIAINPGYVEAHNNLGILFKEQKRFDEAAKAYQCAITINPNHAEIHNNLGIVLKEQKRFDEAEKAYQRAITTNTNYAEVHNNLGNLLKDQKRFDEAEKAYLRAITINPDYIDVYNNLGNLLKEQKRFDEAERAYQRAITTNPNHAEIHNNLGIVLKEQKRFSEAEKAYQRTIKINPNHAEAHNNLGLLYKEQQRVDEAEKAYQRAISINPNYADAHNNLGLLLEDQQRLDEAEKSYQDALIIDPENANSHFFMGHLLTEQKRFDEAEKAYRKAIILNPDNADANWDLALLLTTLTRFDEGWQYYESRYHPDIKSRGTIPPTISVPQYQGESLGSKSLLIWPEQGIGDAIMFASILPELENAGANIILACEHRLINLFKRSFPFIGTVAKDPDNRYQDLAPSLDYHLAMGSLPKFYRNQIEDFDRDKPYLKADEALTAVWKQRYQALEHPINIGISWFGGHDEKRQRDRSIALKDWLPILNYPANFIDLQYGDHQAYVQEFKQQTGIHIHDWEDADPIKDIDNFASQIKSLDLVISIDNSTVHFSGALGVETFVMLPFNQDWRWAEEREDSYWYPGVMRLFRQTTYGDWDSVIARVAQALGERFN